MSSNRRLQPTVGLGLALILLACATAALVHLQPERLRAPAWVAYLALGAFGFAGVCVIAQALRLHGLGRWLICILLASMTAIPSWIALGSGPRQCTSGGLAGRLEVSEFVCRGAFGIGAVLLGLMFLIALRDALRSRQVR